MRLGIRAPQLRTFERRFGDAPLTTAVEMRAGLESSVRVLETAVRAEAHESFRPYIKGRVTGDGINLRGEVTGDTASKPHMKWQNYGTATRRIIGTRSPYNIFPRRARALRFVWHGVRIFATKIIGHPGIFAKNFFGKGYASAVPNIRRIMGGHLGNITKSLRSGSAR